MFFGSVYSSSGVPNLGNLTKTDLEQQV